MKSLSLLALFSAFVSLCFAQETFPGAKFNVSTSITGLGASADLTQAFATISGTILQRKTTPPTATRQEGLWSTPPSITTQLTPFGGYLLTGTTVVKFTDFGIKDGALIDLRLGVQGGPGIIPNILFNVSYSSLCSSLWTVMGNSTLLIYEYNGLVC
ncbi:hypothetical protein B0H10DRAFT_2182947 [Mycena sp. CBHHK59/15]|nr:hypothetical protein B0H10DRAFT_2182947 [Mycena sp. CBHHK59/15]